MLFAELSASENLIKLQQPIPATESIDSRIYIVLILQLIASLVHGRKVGPIKVVQPRGLGSRYPVSGCSEGTEEKEATQDQKSTGKVVSINDMGRRAELRIGPLGFTTKSVDISAGPSAVMNSGVSLCPPEVVGRLH